MQFIDPKLVRVCARTIGSLQLVHDFLKLVDFAEIIDRICPANSQLLLSYGRVSEVMVANRLCCPRPLYKVQEWSQKAGVEEVFGIAPELLNDDRLGRTLEVLAENAPVLKGEIALEVAKRFKIGLDKLHWDLTTVYLEGAYEQQRATGVRITYAKDGNSGGRANKAIKVGLDVANDGAGAVPIYYEALDGNANGYEATIRNMENLKKALRLDRIIRINDRGCHSAKIVAHSKRQGFDIISSLSITPVIEQKIREALASGARFEPLDYLSVNQQKKKPSERQGYAAFEMAHEFIHEGKSYPMRLVVVKSDGKLKREQKARMKHTMYIEAHLAELQNKVGQRGWTEGRMQKSLQKILGKYREGKYYEVHLEASEGRPTELRYRFNERAAEEEAIMEGIYAIVTSLPAEEYPLKTVFRLFKEQHVVERSNRLMKGPIRITPLFLQNTKRIEGLLLILWLALMVYLLVERIYRNQTRCPRNKRRTTRALLEAFDWYEWTVLEGRCGRAVYPNPLTDDQVEIYEALGLKASCGGFAEQYLVR